MEIEALASTIQSLLQCRGDTLSQSYTVGPDGHSLTNATSGALDWQCFEPSAALHTEAWRELAEFERRSLFGLMEMYNMLPDYIVQAQTVKLSAILLESLLDCVVEDNRCS